MSSERQRDREREGGKYDDVKRPTDRTTTPVPLAASALLARKKSFPLDLSRAASPHRKRERDCKRIKTKQKEPVLSLFVSYSFFPLISWHTKPNQSYS